MYRSGLIQCTEIVLSNVPKWYRRKLCTEVVIVCTEVAMYRSSTVHPHVLKESCTENALTRKPSSQRHLNLIVRKSIPRRSASQYRYADRDGIARGSAHIMLLCHLTVEQSSKCIRCDKVTITQLHHTQTKCANEHQQLAKVAQLRKHVYSGTDSALCPTRKRLN